MFVKSSESEQLNLFSCASSSFSGKSLSGYENELGWHNLFRKNVTMNIKEELFNVLYSSGTGAPNSSIRVMLAMMILKEAQGLSDAKIFEEGRYNALTRSALGILNWDDSCPTESTYYLFRRSIAKYASDGNGDLMEQMFSDLTTKQCVDFEVSGKRIRMDSKLLGSNIAWLSRYEIVHTTIRLAYKSIKGCSGISPDILKELDAIFEVEGKTIVYKYSSEEVRTKLQKLGLLIQTILPLFEKIGGEHYQTLLRVFEDQFQVNESKEVISKDNKDISPKSVQSPHDTEATYRNKDGNQVRGNAINITETCNDTGLNLIVNTDTRPVTTPDIDFLESRINKSLCITKEMAEIVHADGAYNSPANQTFCEQNKINLTLHAIQGKISDYELIVSESGEVSVLHRESRQDMKAVKTESKDGRIRWRIKTLSQKYRYFTQKDIDGQLLREKIAKTPLEELRKRNNVEATIFQLGYHYPNNKSRYRGLVKHQMWANIRCAWVNFVRIAKFTIKKACVIVFCCTLSRDKVISRGYRWIKEALNCLFQNKDSNFLKKQLGAA